MTARVCRARPRIAVATSGSRIGARSVACPACSSSQPRQDHGAGRFSTSFPARMQVVQGWRIVMPRIQVPGSTAVVVSLMPPAPGYGCPAVRRGGR